MISDTNLAAAIRVNCRLGWHQPECGLRLPLQSSLQQIREPHVTLVPTDSGELKTQHAEIPDTDLGKDRGHHQLRQLQSQPRCVAKVPRDGTRSCSPSPFRFKGPAQSLRPLSARSGLLQLGEHLPDHCLGWSKGVEQ